MARPKCLRRFSALPKPLFRATASTGESLVTLAAAVEAAITELDPALPLQPA